MRTSVNLISVPMQLVWCSISNEGMREGLWIPTNTVDAMTVKLLLLQVVPSSRGAELIEIKPALPADSSFHVNWWRGWLKVGRRWAEAPGNSLHGNKPTELDLVKCTLICASSTKLLYFLQISLQTTTRFYRRICYRIKQFFYLCAIFLFKLTEWHFKAQSADN